MPDELSVPVNRLEYEADLWIRREDVATLANAGFYFEVIEHDTFAEAEEEGPRYSRVQVTGHGDAPDDEEAEDFEPYVCDECGREFGPDEYDTKTAAAGARAGHGQAHRAEEAHDEDEAETAVESERTGANPPGRTEAKGMSASPDDADEDDEQTGLDELYPDEPAGDVDEEDLREKLEGAAEETP